MSKAFSKETHFLVYGNITHSVIHWSKGNVFYGQEPPSGESTTTECGFNYQLLAVILLKQPNGEPLVAVNQNQLRTMASETVDPIDWLHPPPYKGSTPWAPPIAHCNAGWAGNHKTYCTEWDPNVRPSEYQTNALPVRPLRVFFVENYLVLHKKNR